MKRHRLILALFPLLLSACAHYEYNIVEPADLTRHIGSKVDTVVAVEPLEYRMRAVDNRLVLRIFDQSDDPITLVGDRSAIVDAAGQSHPTPTQTMAPRSFVKVILPPLKPQLYHSGPMFGFGVGTRIGSAAPVRSIPRYMVSYGADDAIYFDWEGESTLRVTFVYQRKDKTFEHRFVFRRQKM